MNEREFALVRREDFELVRDVHWRRRGRAIEERVRERGKKKLTTESAESTEGAEEIATFRVKGK